MKKNGGFRMVLPPITVVIGGEMIILDGKYSENAFKNCIKLFLAQKLTKIWIFQKHSTKNFNFWVDLGPLIDGEKEREIDI